MGEIRTFEKKLRVQLFDTEFNQLSDRLVRQDTEFRKGPEEEHLGPLKIEACLFTPDDVDGFIVYLKKLRGVIPKEIKVKKPKAAGDDPDINNRSSFLEKVIGEVQDKTISNQEDLIKSLRGAGFVFLTWEAMPRQNQFELNSKDNVEQWQWMVKLVREAKNPINNKYDPRLVFGFKLLGGKVEEVWTILDFSDHTKFELPWKRANADYFKKTEMAKFPPYMIPEEREKFSIELYKLRKDPELIPSKFFLRWYKDVEFREKAEWEGTRLK